MRAAFCALCACLALAGCASAPERTAWPRETPLAPAAEAGELAAASALELPHTRQPSI
jgi:hypothetical protein